MNERLVSLDLDGTILVYDDPGGRLSPEVIKALNKFPDLRAHWCINSGRTLEDQEQIVARARRDGLELSPCALLVRESMIYQYGENFQGLEPWNSRAIEKILDLHRRVRALPGDPIGQLIKEHKPTDLLTTDSATSFLLGDADRANRFQSALKQHLTCVPEALISRNNLWVFVLHRDLGKGEILRVLMEILGFSDNDVLAVGDNDNDIDMLTGAVCRYVGCPANSTHAVKETVRRANGRISTLEAPAGTIEIMDQFLRAI